MERAETSVGGGRSSDLLMVEGSVGDQAVLRFSGAGH
jgi:hypothetical protein